jgi:hypothetical protein
MEIYLKENEVVGTCYSNEKGKTYIYDVRGNILMSSPHFQIRITKFTTPVLFHLFINVSSVYFRTELVQ